MKNNIFSKENGKLFYTPINGEIYQVRFTSLSIPLKYADGNVIYLNDYAITTAIVEIASLGKHQWSAIDNNSFDLMKIYLSVEDAVAATNPVFRYERGHGAHVTDIVPPMEIKKCDCIPPRGFWFSEDMVHWKIQTYQWTGLSVQMRDMRTDDKERAKFNGNYVLHYDLVSESFILDSEYLKTCYASYEECVNANAIKVHRF